ncbi:MAG: membrane lipoprotein lipid attachment site-containing protein [Deltaproteobacteria bacterium]|nr:membrane lipoprotein lipid attachment site-containing protein [Deltaproteobacteria bacterium]
MKRIVTLAGAALVLAGCSVIDLGASREAEYFEQVKGLEDKVEELTKQFDDAKARIAELESDEHARFIDAYLARARARPPTRRSWPGTRSWRTSRRARWAAPRVSYATAPALARWSRTWSRPRSTGCSSTSSRPPSRRPARC